MGRLVVANWKMNLSLAEAEALAHAEAKVAEQNPGLTVSLAVPTIWLASLHTHLHFKPKNLSLCAQGVSEFPEGAYTGDTAASQVKQLVTYGLVGHSERRRYHHESGASIAQQVKLLLNEGIKPIICFGEMRQSQQATFSPQITVDLGKDLHGLTKEEIAHCHFAYEPLWAIGTGHPADAKYVQKAVAHVKTWLAEHAAEGLPVLYGGSVTSKNAAELSRLKELDGLLVGGASLNAKEFAAICRAFHDPL
jgi:triosephosphate isomerase